MISAPTVQPNRRFVRQDGTQRVRTFARGDSHEITPEYHRRLAIVRPATLSAESLAPGQVPALTSTDPCRK
jgi:hypothetical protein